MEQVVELKEQEIIDFPKCDGITTATVCKTSGLLAGEGCATKTEYFAVGTVPTSTCGGHTTIEMCAESNLPATNACPETYTLTYFRRADGSIYIPTDMDDREIPDGFESQTCPLHPALPDDEVPDEDGNFTITSSVNGTGGTITETAKVPKNGSKTFYITPATGYTIGDVQVDGVSVGAVSSYTFNNVNKNHTIVVKFKTTSDDGTTASDAPPSTDTSAPSTEASTDASTDTPTTNSIYSQYLRYIQSVTHVQIM
jgi:hypothetical protein